MASAEWYDLQQIIGDGTMHGSGNVVQYINVDITILLMRFIHNCTIIWMALIPM